MSVHEDINKAIVAHGQWKQTLQEAIDTGVCESTPDRVKMDCHCSFGKWLHQRIDPAVKDTADYKEIVDLHAQFHREAGSILELALNSEADKARLLMRSGDKFSMLSGSLILKMKAWKQHLVDA